MGALDRLVRDYPLAGWLDLFRVSPVLTQW